MSHHHHHGHDAHAHDAHGHSHEGHGRAHDLHAGGDSRRALGFALVASAVFLVVELVAGALTGSLALLSDAAHMVSDVGALFLALAAAQVATRKADATMTFGLGRAEILGAFLNGVVLVFASIWIVVEAVGRLVAGAPEVAGMPVLVVGVLGLGINLASAWFLHGADHGNMNVRAAMLHVIGDALGSVAAIVAALLLMAGIPGADPVASLVVAGLVVIGAVRLLRDAGRVLLELPPTGLDVARVREALVGIEGVVGVHDLHAWSLDGRTPLVTAHLVVAEAESDSVCQRARQLLDGKFGVHHTTLQVERPNGACATRCGDV